jgi:hypothetical protein
MNTRTFNFEDMTNAEHHVLETGVYERLELEDQPLDTGTLTVRAKHTVKDWARNAETQFVLYEQGLLKLKETQRGKTLKSHQLQLRYLDPVPTLDSHRATRVLYAAAACGGVAVLAMLLGQFAIFQTAALSVSIVAATACCVALMLAAYRSYQRTTFYTLHGRSAAIQLKAAFGSRRRMRELLPVLSNAIEEAAESIGDDMAVYLREEMREHYRLRGDGVLTPEDCGNGTGRILAQFDGPLSRG